MGAPSETIVRKIVEMLRRFEASKIQFIRRDGNLVADYLAKSCASHIVDIQIIDSPSMSVKKLLLDDLSATCNIWTF